MSAQPNRDTIELEACEILSHRAFPGDQYILRVHAPRMAAKALPGSFAHIQCHDLRPLRRPISLMRASQAEGWVDFLYKAIGDGTRLLATREVGERLSIIGPIGVPFQPNPERPRTLLIGGGVGMPPMVFLAEALKDNPAFAPFAILGSEVPFPFAKHNSNITVPGIAVETHATMPLLEEWGVPARLCSLQGYAGCHQGYVTDLARHWLEALSEQERQQVEIFSCGPHPMLAAVAALAQEFGLPCQVSLEEHMACGIGGCAGCTVAVETETGTAMKRVCVDGPVFDARGVFGG